MDLFDIIIITMQITNIVAKSKKYQSSSEEESIENLVYYKDCQHKSTVAPSETKVLRMVEPEPPKQPDCPFPKMCCSMSCGNECNSGPQSFISRQMEPLENMQQLQMPMQPMVPRQPPIQSPLGPRGRKKKMKPNLMPPLMTRRNAGPTKDKIKSLISKDDDIRKILKDLVQVTMQKVDVLETVNAKDNINLQTPYVSPIFDEE